MAMAQEPSQDEDPIGGVFSVGLSALADAGSQRVAKILQAGRVPSERKALAQLLKSGFGRTAS
jgi:hypothetical protein